MRSRVSREIISRSTARLCDAVLAAAETGEYKISGNDYVAQATTAINSILRLANAVGEAADQEAAKEAANSSSKLLIAGLIFLGCIALAFVSFWIAFWRTAAVGGANDSDG